MAGKQYTTEKAIKLFWDRVKIEDVDSCWLWQRSTATGGYGRFGFQRKMYRAHRLAWMFTYGDIPEGLWVLHQCDNPACCNPHHLFLGTPLDNTRDMDTKGRRVNAPPQKGLSRAWIKASRGTDRYNAKLNEDLVREVRRRHLHDHITAAQMGREYGLNPNLLRMVIRKEIWKHID